MRLSLIGPGDIEFHYQTLLGINKKKLQAEIDSLAKVLVEADVELELLPDKGISIELAKSYKLQGGRRVVGSVPKSDKTFGIEHLEKFIKTEVNGKPLFEEIIDSGDWFKHDLIKGLLGNAVLYLGASPGTDGERHYAVYLYKLISGFKQGVEVSGKKINPEILAGKNFTIFVYTPFLISKKLAPEDEAYMKKFGINLIYVNNPKELREKINLSL